MNFLSILITAGIGLAVLSFLVIIHEAGHFFAARFFKVKVLEFGIGFPFLGRIFSFKKGETVYSLNWLFFGGFVQLYGEEAGSAKGPHSFADQPVWKRIIIAGAGVFVNITFAILLFTILLATSNFRVDFQQPFRNTLPFGNQEQYVLIVGVEEDSPAKEAGLTFLDRIKTLDGQSVSTVTETQNIVKENTGNSILIEVENIKTNETKEVSVTPRENPPAGQGALGIGLDEGVRVSYDSPAEKIFSGVLHSVNMLDLQLAGLTEFVRQSFQERSIEPVAANAGGPVRIVAVLGILVQNSGAEAIRVLLTITALISLILGVGNLLPLPAIDGGRLFFFYIEAIFRKKINPKVENMIHAIGFFVLLSFLALVTLNDITKLLSGRIFG